MASRPGAAPDKLSFGDSAARWCATYERRKLKGVARTSARHAQPLQQRTNTITVPTGRELRPQVFHGGPFGVWGTPPTKPLDCKSLGFCVWRLFARQCIDPDLKICRRCLSLLLLKQKTLLTFGKQGLKIAILYFTCLPGFYPNTLPVPHRV
jgi:hypothetical protein